MKGLELDVRTSAIKAIARRVQSRLDTEVEKIFADAQEELEIEDGGVAPDLAF